MNKKIIIIAGATASGKSSKALNLISNKIDKEKIKKVFDIEVGKTKEDFDNFGEIISADSRQIYKNISIFSGISDEEEKAKKDGKIHLLNFLDEWERFSAGDFEKKAWEKINKIIEKNKIPVIVGGTSFYFKSLIYDNFLPKVDINVELREKFEKKTIEELLNILEKKDKKRFESIDKNNKPRIIRAIEICEELGYVPENVEKIKKDLDIIFIWIKVDREEQKEKIKNNFEKRINNGFFEEAQNLLKILKKKGKKENEIENIFYNLGLSYKFIFKFWNKEITLEKFIELGILEEQKYAKRQNTYLKKFFKELPESILKIEI